MPIQTPDLRATLEKDLQSIAQRIRSNPTVGKAQIAGWYVYFEATGLIVAALSNAEYIPVSAIGTTAPRPLGSDRRQASLFVSDDYCSLFLTRGECYRMVIS